MREVRSAWDSDGPGRRRGAPIEEIEQQESTEEAEEPQAEPPQSEGEGAAEQGDQVAEEPETEPEIEVGAIITGTVARIEAYGAFLKLHDGRLGLVHISEIDRNYVRDVHDHLRENDKVEAKVTAIKDDGKIDLSIKALQDPAPKRLKRGSDPGLEQKLKQFRRQSEERMVDYRRARDKRR
ncbi:MAG: S1 RNA-binding domain-containing protein [Actinomycetota bacterium]